jgi:ribonuclease BN (tRNA processing enzyme)
MRLTVVGCSGSFPGPDSASSCYLVEHDGFRLVVDLGQGSIGPLQRHLDLDLIDAVWLSHLHADHWLDLTALYVVRRHHHSGPQPALDVHGPGGTATRFVAAYGAATHADVGAVFSFRSTGPGPVQVGPFRMTLARTAHPVECYAARIEAGGRTLTYSADTGESAEVTALASGSDLLLAEATFMESESNPAGLHLTGRQAATMARNARAGRLVLTHVPPWHDADEVLEDARAVDPGCALATSGAVYDV